MSLHDALASLPWANSGIITAATNLTTNYLDVIYLEPEAPTRAQWAWADGHLTPFRDHRYIFEGNAPGVYSNESRVPPLGVRSAPPLGGLAAGTVELRADGTLRGWTIENASPAGSSKTAWLDAATLGVRVDGVARLLRTHPPTGLEGSGVAALQFSGASPFARLIPVDPALAEAHTLRLYGRSRWRVGDMAASALPALAFTLTAVNSNASAPLDLSLFLSLPIQLQTGMLRKAEKESDHAKTLNTTSAADCARACTSSNAINANRTTSSLFSSPKPRSTSRCASWSFEQATSRCVFTGDFARVPPAANSPTREFAAEGDSLDGAGVAGTWHISGTRQSVRSRRLPTADRDEHGMGDCLILNRPGTHAAAGEVALCGSAETTFGDTLSDTLSDTRCGNGQRGSARYGTSFATASSLADLWAPFAETGALNSGDGGGGVHPDGLIGGGAVSVRVPPRAKVSLTLSLGWRFPYRDFMGATIGNQYAQLYADAKTAAEVMLEGELEELRKDAVARGSEEVDNVEQANGQEHEPKAECDGQAATRAASRGGSSTLSAAEDIRDWAGFASTLIGPHSSLPAWLGDSILNTLHHARSAFWLADGRFRQWESFSCVNVDSVHNDGERHLPYLLLWPHILPSKMRAWAAGQQEDGMIREQLACGCMDAIPPKLDDPCGRTMGDVSSMFTTYLYEYWLWGPADMSVALVEELWPSARSAAAWQIRRANRTSLHLPDFLADTYDGLNLAQYNASSFSAFFHLLAMRACSELARLPMIGDHAFAAECDESLRLSRSAIDSHLWEPQRGFYMAYTAPSMRSADSEASTTGIESGTALRSAGMSKAKGTPAQVAVMGDSLYAQVLSDSLGLGTLHPPDPLDTPDPPWPPLTSSDTPDTPRCSVTPSDSERCTVQIGWSYHTSMWCCARMGRRMGCSP